MNRLHRLIAAASSLAGFASLAVAGEVPPAFFRAVDLGVPTDGTRVMTGYRGYVVQAVSTVGPIRRVDLDRGEGLGSGIFGGLAQRWTDPSATSNYTVTSPGPLPEARNDRGPPSDLNFDSHFL